MDRPAAWEIALALPATLAGAWLAPFIYRRLADRGCQRVVMALLLALGLILIRTSW